MSARSAPVFDMCWFCRRTVPIRNLIAGYDTWEEQRLACDDCDRTLKAMATRGYYFTKSRPDPLTVPETGSWHDESPPEKRGISALTVLAVLGVVACLVVMAVRP